MDAYRSKKTCSIRPHNPTNLVAIPTIPLQLQQGSAREYRTRLQANQRDTPRHVLLFHNPHNPCTIQQSSCSQIAYVRETGNRSQRQAQSTRIHSPQPGHTVHLSNLQPPKDYPIKPWPLADRHEDNQQLDCDRQPNHNSPRTSTIMPVAIR